MKHIYTIPLIRTNARNAACCCCNFLFTPKSQYEEDDDVYTYMCVCVHLNHSRLKFTHDCKVMSNNDKDAKAPFSMLWISDTWNKKCVAAFFSVMKIMHVTKYTHIQMY